MLQGKKIYKSKPCRRRAHILTLGQGMQLVLKCPTCQLTIISAPKGSCTIPLLQPGQESHLSDPRLLSALQAHGDLLVTPCKGNRFPQLGWKSPKFSSPAKVSQDQLPAEQWKAPSLTDNHYFFLPCDGKLWKYLCGFWVFVFWFGGFCWGFFSW